MRALSFPKCCVVCCKKCGHDVLAGTDGFPAGAIAVICSVCGERRRYLPSEVMHGRPHHPLVRAKRPSPVTAKRGPMAAGSLRNQRASLRQRGQLNGLALLG